MWDVGGEISYNVRSVTPDKIKKKKKRVPKSTLLFNKGARLAALFIKDFI